MNSTSGKRGEAVLNLPRTRAADAALWQEHNYTEALSSDVHARLQAVGRRAFLAPAICGKAGATTSGGVGVVTAAHVGHGAPALLDKSILDAGRLVVRHLRGMIPGGIMCGSIYAPVLRSVEGRAAHDALLLKLSRYLANVNRRFIVGGDWNCTPADLCDSSIPARLQATVVFGKDATCFSRTQSGLVSRVLDHFLVSDCLFPLVQAVDVWDVCIKPHLAVMLEIRGFAVLEKVRAPLGAPPLPVERPFGPDETFES